MAEGISLDEHGLALVERDARWHVEVRREMLQSILDVEHRAIAANLLAWFLAGLAALALPNTAIFLLPLTGRLVAMFAARLAFARLRARIAAKTGFAGEVRWLTLALAISGASCAPVLTPILLDPFIHPARMVIGGTVIVGVTLAYTLLAPVPRLATAYLGGFIGTFTAIMLLAPYPAAAAAIFGLCGVLSITVLYGLAKSIRQRGVAEMLVDNRHLSEELSDSLAHAEFLALRDPLTGLLNRRAFFQRAEATSSQSERHVLTIDLDHFKTVNDRFGHGMGDSVLVSVSNALRAVLKSVDSGDHFAARLGGEEFAVVLAVSDRALAASIAEMVRHSIALVAHDIGRPGLVTTASIGLSDWRPGESLDDVLGRADAALYRAKARGRDRVQAAAA